MTPTLFALLVVGGGLLGSSGTAALYLQVVFCLFGAAAAIQLPVLGGASITPAVLFLPFLLARALGERGLPGCLREVAYPRAGFWLLLLAAWGVLGAYYLPRIFAGDVLIRTVDRDAMELGTMLVPLHPVSGNITQTGYALGGVCAFLAVSSLLSTEARLDSFRDAVLLLTALNGLAGVLNLAEFYLGLPTAVLGSVRNAGYSMLDQTHFGMKRISGTFPETSAFSAFTLPLLGFTFSLWRSKVRPSYSGALAAVSLVLLLLSTSTTAYVSIVIYVAVLGVSLVWRGMAYDNIPRGWDLMLMGSILGILLLSMVFLWKPEVAERVFSLFESTVLNKMATSSGIERSSWNQQAWSNFLDTYGLGIGLGSARASSFLIVLLSNVGVIGAMMFAMFLGTVLKGDGSGRTTGEVAVRKAARQAVIGYLIPAFISGGIFDLGIAFYAFAAAAAATVAPRQTKREIHGCCA